MAQRTLVPLKVKIKLGSEGAKYPDFNQIAPAIRENMDWSHFIDNHGVGWHYDQTSGLGEDSVDSPFGEQWGMMIVPSAFATEAVSKFPNEVEVLTENLAEMFYDEKAHVKDEAEIVNVEALQAIKVREDLGEDMTAKKAKALNPNELEAGVRKNKSKTWSDFKALKNIIIK